MKKLVIIFLGLFPSLLFAQSSDNESKSFRQNFNFSMGIGSSTFAPSFDDIDQVINTNATFIFSYTQHIKGRSSFEFGLGLKSDMIVSDGMFIENNEGKFMFSKVPDNFKNNNIRIIRLEVPLRYLINFNEEDYISFGLKPGAVISKRHFYKVGDEKFNNTSNGVSPFLLDFEVVLGNRKINTRGFSSYSAEIGYSVLSLAADDNLRLLSLGLSLGF